jgi:phospholipid/cholesterol/gamma-HCH transport system substrate-binding protein
MSAAGKTIGQNNAAEVLIGLLVVVLAVAAIAYGYMHKGAGGSGYDIVAQLPKVDGLGVGTDVRISGIKVGSISDIKLNPTNYLVTVTMNIDKGVEIPTDSSLILTQSGVLGSQYISIQPGGDDKVLAAGGAITNVQAANSNDLMSLAGRFIGGDSGQQKPAPAPAPSAPKVGPQSPQSLPPGP